MVVGPAWQELGYLGPLIPILFVCLYDPVVFLLGPLVLLDIWVQVVVPPLSALLSNPTRQGLRYITPVFGSKSMYIFREFLILLNTPRTFHHRRIQHFLPPVQALNIRALVEEGSNAFPVLGTESLHKLCQLLVLLCVPVPLVIMRVLICYREGVDVLLRLDCLIRRVHVLESKARIGLSLPLASSTCLHILPYLCELRLSLILRLQS